LRGWGAEATVAPFANKEAPMKKLLMTLIAFAFMASGTAVMAGTATAEKDTKAAKDKPADKAEKSAPAPKEGEKPAEKAKK
jgi:hypothetical protein